MPRKASGSRLSSTECRVSATVSDDQRQVDPEDRPPGEQRRSGRRRRPGRARSRSRSRRSRCRPPCRAPRPRRWRRRSPASPGPAAPRRSPAGPGRRPGTRAGASAQSAEVAPKAISPVTNIRRRPNWSPSEPPTRSSDDQGQHVGLDHPLLPGEAGVEAVADRRQGDVDDRASRGRRRSSRGSSRSASGAAGGTPAESRGPLVAASDRSSDGDGKAETKLTTRALLGSLLCDRDPGPGAAQRRGGKRSLGARGARVTVTAAGLASYRYTSLSPGDPGQADRRRPHRSCAAARSVAGGICPAATRSRRSIPTAPAAGSPPTARPWFWPPSSPSGARRDTSLAVLDTAIHLRHPGGRRQAAENTRSRGSSCPANTRLPRSRRTARTAFLTHYRAATPGARRWRVAHALRSAALDTRSGRLLRDPVVNENAVREPLRGLPISRGDEPRRSLLHAL